MDTSLGKRCRESDDLFNFKNSNGIIRLQASITKKYPIISNKIFDYIDINSIKFNNIDYIKSYYIIFYIIILSELAESCFYTKDSLDNILKYFLEYIEQYEINLYEINSFKSLMNILKLDDFWNLNSSEKTIIYNFIFPILISNRGSFKDHIEEIKSINEYSPFSKLFLYLLGDSNELPSFDNILCKCLSYSELNYFVIYLYEKKIIQCSSEHFLIAIVKKNFKMIKYYIKKNVEKNTNILYMLKLLELEGLLEYKINLFCIINVPFFKGLSILFASSGHIDILKEFTQRNIQLSYDVLYEAAKHGHQNIIFYFLNLDYIKNFIFLNELMINMLIILIKHKHYDVFNSTFHNINYNHNFIKKFILELFQHAEYDSLKFIYTHYYGMLKSIIKPFKKFYLFITQSLTMNDINYIYFLFDIYIEIKNTVTNLHKHKIIKSIIINGNIEILIQFINKFSIDLSMFNNISSLCVEHNNLPILRYLTEHNVYKDKNVITLAIEKNNFDIMKYAIENNYPYHIELKTQCEEKLKILKYLSQYFNEN